MIDPSVVASSLLLVLALAALGSAGIRLSALITPSGLERVVSCAVFVAAAAVLEALVLGRFGLGGSTLSLSGAAVVTWLVARRWLPAPVIPPGNDLRRWWHRLGLVDRAGIGALMGGVVAIAITILRRPAPGFDGVTYHIPEVVGFVQSGHTGSVLNLYYGLPVGNYPLTNEVLLSWLTGISHGFAAMTLWSPASYVLLFAAGWLALRVLHVPTAPRVLAICALVLGPLVVATLPTPDTDLTATTWLVCCAALCLAARRRPLLLAPAILALGLSVGTKTTGALLGILVLGFAVWDLRGRLRALARPAALGVVAAAGVGAPWYIRNLVEHGSPLWPFLAAPWGDPVPLTVQLVSHTLAERFRETLLDHFSAYLSSLSGSFLLIVGGVLVPLLSFRRRPLIACAAVVTGLVAWANAPVTGLPDVPGLSGAVLSSVRYLLPVFAASTAALALAASEGPKLTRMLAITVLCATVAWSLVSDVEQSFFLPFSSWLAPGVVIGAALAAVSRPIAATRPRAAIASAVMLIVVCTGGLAVASRGFMARHADVATEWDASAAGFLSRQASFASARTPVAAAPDALGLLAGDRLQHRVSVIPETASCSQLRSLAQRSWLVVLVIYPRPLRGHPGVLYPPRGSAQACLARAPERFDGGGYRIYGPRS